MSDLKEQYLKRKYKRLDGITPALLGNCKRLVYILENMSHEELFKDENYRVRAEVKNKIKEIRRDTLALRKEFL